MSERIDLNPSMDRRRLLGGLGLVLAGGVPVLLAGCGNPQGSAPEIDEANDLRLVQKAREMELALVAGYTKVVTLLEGSARPLGEQILAQEKLHANGLVTVIGDLGGTPVEPKTQAQYDVALGLPELTTQADALAFASQLEQTTIFAYIDGVPKLTIGDLRATFASLATSAAEHVAVLTGIAEPGDPAAQSPGALVRGLAPAGTPA